MKTVLKMELVFVLALFLAFAGLQARILPDDPNNVSADFSSALEKLTLSSMTKTVLCKWLIINMTVCDDAATSDDVGGRPGRAPPSPRPAPGTRPIAAY